MISLSSVLVVFSCIKYYSTPADVAMCNGLLKKKRNSTCKMTREMQAK